MEIVPDGKLSVDNFVDNRLNSVDNFVDNLDP